MPHEDYHLTGRDGLRLYTQSWLPAAPAKATLAVVHGFTEHGGRYARLASDLNRYGYAVYAMDLRGHGRSEGERVLVRRFGEYLADLDVLLDHVVQQAPARPLVLFGHSMGGVVAARWAIERTQAAERAAADGAVARPQRHEEQVCGLVLSGPGLRVGQGVFPILRRLAPCVAWCFPRLRLVGMGCRYLSRDPHVVQEFGNDPLVYHDRFPVGTAVEILRAGRSTLRDAQDIRLPLLILQGTGDRVVQFEAARELYERAGAEDKTLKLYEGFYHEVLSEPERQRVLDDLVGWLETRCRVR